MQLKLLTISNAGVAGNRGIEATLAMLHSFKWRDMRGDAEAFVSECILWLLYKTWSKIPRSLVSTMQGARPNQVFHFDYLFLGSSDTNHMYALKVKDEISEYSWLEP